VIAELKAWLAAEGSETGLEVLSTVYEPKRIADIVSGLLVDGVNAVTAVRHDDAAAIAQRTVRALLDGGTVLRRPVLRRVERVLVIADRYAAETWRTRFNGDPRVAVVKALPGFDLARSAELVAKSKAEILIVDDTTMLIIGKLEAPAGGSLVATLEDIGLPVILVMTSFQTSHAPQGFHLILPWLHSIWCEREKKTNACRLHVNVDANGSSGPVDITALLAEEEPQAPELDVTAAQIRTLGKFAEEVNVKRHGAGTATELFMASPAAFTAITGRHSPTGVDQYIEKYATAFDEAQIHHLDFPVDAPF
jgi:hypothetical protein